MDIFKIFAVLYLLKRYSEKFDKDDMEGRTKLHKLVFLSQMEGDIDYFKFVPYYYGPFSFDLRDTIERAILYGLVEEREDDGRYFYKITDKGKEFLKILEMHLEKEKLKEKGEQIKTTIDKILEKYGRLSRKDIVKYVYERYPKFRPGQLKITW